MRFALVGLCMLAMSIVGCAGGSGAAKSEDGAKSKAAANGEAKAAKPMTVEGVAKDGMISALVVDDKGVAYMVPSLGRWPDAAKGKRVRVTGQFVQDDRFMGKTVDGVPQQGTAGNDRILLKAKYEVIK